MSHASNPIKRSIDEKIPNKYLSVSPCSVDCSFMPRVRRHAGFGRCAHSPMASPLYVFWWWAEHQRYHCIIIKFPRWSTARSGAFVRVKRIKNEWKTLLLFFSSGWVAAADQHKLFPSVCFKFKSFWFDSALGSVSRCRRAEHEQYNNTCINNANKSRAGSHMSNFVSRMKEK